MFLRPSVLGGISVCTFGSWFGSGMDIISIRWMLDYAFQNVCSTMNTSICVDVWISIQNNCFLFG